MNHIIVPGEQNTAGIKLDEVDPIEYLGALARKMKLLEQDLCIVRQRLNNSEIEVGMLKETLDKYHKIVDELEKKIECKEEV